LSCCTGLADRTEDAGGGERITHRTLLWHLKEATISSWQNLRVLIRFQGGNRLYKSVSASKLREYCQNWHKRKDLHSNLQCLAPSFQLLKTVPPRTNGLEDFLGSPGTSGTTIVPSGQSCCISPLVRHQQSTSAP